MEYGKRCKRRGPPAFTGGYTAYLLSHQRKIIHPSLIKARKEKAAKNPKTILYKVHLSYINSATELL